MLIDIDKNPKHRKYAGVALIVLGVLLLLPRLLSDGTGGISPIFGLMLIVFGSGLRRSKPRPPADEKP